MSVRNTTGTNAVHLSNPKVLISRNILEKIRYLVNKAPGEISGIGKVITLENGDFYVNSAILVEQENGATDTELDGAAFAKAMYDLRDEPGELKFWWHSHVNMDVFFSGTDHEAIKQLGDDSWIIATVFNKKYEDFSAYYQGPKKDTDGAIVAPAIFMDGLQLQQKVTYPQAVIDAWDKEYKEKCKVKKWSRPSSTSGSTRGTTTTNGITSGRTVVKRTIGNIDYEANHGPQFIKSGIDTALWSGCKANNDRFFPDAAETRWRSGHVFNLFTAEWVYPVDYDASTYKSWIDSWPLGDLQLLFKTKKDKKRAKNLTKIYAMTLHEAYFFMWYEEAGSGLAKVSGK